MADSTKSLISLEMSDTETTKRTIADYAPDRMLELGLLFVKNAINDFDDSQKPELKIHSAILDLFTGTELILKAVLVRKHWSFIFEELTRANLDDLESGEFKSVSFAAAVTRLENLCNITFPAYQKDLIEKLRRRRNRLVHSGSVDEKLPVRSDSTKVLGIVLSFVRQNFKEDREVALLNASLTDFMQKCVKIPQYAKTRLSILKDSYPSHYPHRLMRCFSCENVSVVIEDGVATCHVCDEYTNDPTFFIVASKVNIPEHLNCNGAESTTGCCDNNCIAFGTIEKNNFTVQKVFCFDCGDYVKPEDWEIVLR